jgi:two-component system nitrate/nitrite response regulator NarP
MSDSAAATAEYRRVESFHRRDPGGEVRTRSQRGPRQSAPGSAASEAPVALALIGGRRLLRDATARLLGGRRDLAIVGSYGSAGEFMSGEAPEATDVVVLDHDACDEASDLRSLASLPRRCRYRVVVLCEAAAEEIVACAVALDVDGLILKSYSAEDVGATIRSVAAGHTVMPSGWQQMLAAAEPGTRETLTCRHREVLALIAEGCGNIEIASQLGVSRNTVKFHVRTLYARLGVSNRVQAANLHLQMTHEAA